LKPWSNK